MNQPEEKTIISGDKATTQHPAVVAYRNAFNLSLNAGFRHDIIVTVGDDLELWKQVLTIWKQPHWNEHLQRNFKWNPLNISGLIQYFEREVEKRKERQRERRPWLRESAR